MLDNTRERYKNNDALETATEKVNGQQQELNCIYDEPDLKMERVILRLMEMNKDSLIKIDWWNIPCITFALKGDKPKKGNRLTVQVVEMRFVMF